MPEHEQHQQNNSQAQDHITIKQRIAGSSVAACAELSIGHPLWTIKTRHQDNKPFVLNPRILYRGFFSNMASMMPITSVQVVSSHGLKSRFLTEKTSASEKQNIELVSAFSGGVLAGLFACPVEMVMTHMKHGHGFFATAQNLMLQAGMKRLYTGFVMTAMRDGCFSMGYIALPGVLKPYVRHYLEKEHSVWLSTLVAGVSSAVISQAFDTVKTVQQASKQRIPLGEAIKKPYAKHGFFGHLKGGLPRGVRVASAVCILSTVTEHMNRLFQESNEETRAITKASPSQGSV